MNPIRRIKRALSNTRLNFRLRKARGKHEFVDLLNKYPPNKRGLILSTAFEKDFYDLYSFHREGEFESDIGSFFSYRFYRQGDYLIIELRHPKAALPFHTFIGSHIGQGVPSCQEAIKQEFQA